VTAIDAAQSRRSFWLKTAISLLLAAAAVVAIAVYIHARDRANSYVSGVGGVLGYSAGRPGVTTYADAGLALDGDSSGHRIVAVRSVTPVISVNQSHATVRVLVCVPKDSPVGLVTSLGKWCREIRPFAAGPLDLGNYHAELVLAITPHRPGRLRVNGCRISYLDPPSAGTQHTGLAVATRTLPPKS
jgi:hypothetical protein